MDKDWLLYESLTEMLDEFSTQSFNVFVNSDRKGVGHFLEEQPVRISPINTASVIQLYDKAPQYCDGISADEIDTWKQKVILPTIKERSEMLLSKPPYEAEFEAYYLGRLLQAVSDSNALNALKKWLRGYIRPWLLKANRYPLRVFLIYIAREVLAGSDKTIGAMIDRATEFVVHRQVALGSSSLLSDFDAIDLALAISMTPPGGISTRLVTAATKLLNEAIKNAKTWKNQQLLIRLDSRTVGCSAFEACIALLQSSTHTDVFSLIKPALLSHQQWLVEQRQSNTPFKVSDLYLRDGLIEAWFNLLVVQFLELFKERLYDSKHTSLLAKYKARRSSTKLGWSDLILGDQEKSALKSSFLDEVRSNPSCPRLDRCTVLLFGPTGSAKTTIAKVLAKELAWPLIELGIVDFLKNGLDKIYDTASKIFEDLMRVRHTVVLLDEVEQVFAQRDDNKDLRQQFLTAALLPPLQELHDKKQLIMLIATNYIGEFDPAIRRHGRIDLIIPVGLPEAKHRKRLLEKELGLAKNVAGELAALVPDRATIGELLMFKRIIPLVNLGAGNAASLLYQKWKEWYGHGEVTDNDVSEFKQQCERYRRL